MDGLKEALEYAVEIAAPKVMELELDDGLVGTFSDKQLYPVRPDIPLLTDTIYMSTLSSLVEYLKSDVDAMDKSVELLVHVVSPTKVVLNSTLDANKNRSALARVEHNPPVFHYGNYYDHESFVIAMQSQFIDDPNTNRADLLAFAGTVECGTVASYGDDGISQKAVIKQGVASKADAIVPNPVVLRPYRTFPEVEQPISSFVFRMKDGNRGVECALFEADGGAWKNVAMKNVAAYLEFELADMANVTVIY